MKNKFDWRSNKVVLLILFIFSSICMFLFDGNSPFYINIPSTDPNYYFTIGRALNHGKVLYRDIYDQKGPYMYWLHQMGLKVTPNHGWAVWFFEILIVTAILYLTYKIANLYLTKFGSLIVVACMPVFIFNSNWFIYGDTAELFAFPIFLLGILLILDVLFHPENKLSWWKPFVFGIAIGLMFWVKFTLAISPLMLAFGLFLVIGKKQNWTLAFKTVGWGLLGIFIPTVIVFAYFAKHHALKDLYYYYFYVNIHLYGEPISKTRRLVDILFVRLGSDLRGLILLPAALVVIVIGILSKGLTKGKGTYEQIIISLIVLCCFVSSIAIPFSWGYYIFTINTVVPFALIQIILWIKQLAHVDYKTASGPMCTLILALSLFSIPFVNQNMQLSRLYKNVNPVQAMMQPVKNDPHGTLMTYGVMDFGFYHFANKDPYSKYPAAYNIAKKKFPAPDIEWNNDIKNKSVKYIVTAKNTGVHRTKYLKKNYHRIGKTVPFINYQGGITPNGMSFLRLYERNK